MSFGFSIGDFITVIELVGTIIKAIRETGGASTDFQELIRELSTLEIALRTVQQLETRGSQNAAHIALMAAASNCQRTMDDFWKTICVYQLHLRADGTNPKLKSGWMKIKWVMCKAKDVENFRVQLRGHTGSIHFLLSTIQMNRMTVQGQKQDQYQRTLARRIQDSCFQYMGKLTAISDAVARIEQSHRLFEMTTQVMHTTIQIFQIVHDIHLHITGIPSQVEYQQAVYMVDALGKSTPFHLETVRSREALVALLKANFSDIKGGPGQIDRGEFAIYRTNTKRAVDLSQDWDLCFRPGDRVDMSMIFHWSSYLAKSICPACEIAVKTQYENSGINCAVCGMCFCPTADFGSTVFDAKSLFTILKGTYRCTQSLSPQSERQQRLQEITHSTSDEVVPSTNPNLFSRVCILNRLILEPDNMSRYSTGEREDNNKDIFTVDIPEIRLLEMMITNFWGMSRVN